MRVAKVDNRIEGPPTAGKEREQAEEQGKARDHREWSARSVCASPTKTVRPVGRQRQSQVEQYCS